MIYVEWILGIFIGIIIGRLTHSTEETPEEERCAVVKSKLEQDIKYYKRLTKQLVEENAELRQKLSETE